MVIHIAHIHKLVHVIPYCINQSPVNIPIIYNSP